MQGDVFSQDRLRPHTLGTSWPLLAAEDRDDTLHDQLNALDPVWPYDVTHPAHPVRLIAAGRDPEAQHDAALSDADTPGFQNEGDNEVTGLHVASGSPFVAGMQGRMGSVFHARWFFTQQHGENTVWEIRRES